VAPSGGNGTLHFSLDRVFPWSPESPSLYQLEIGFSGGGMSDSRSLDVGFREFIANGQCFYLNGQQTFLKGVARHEMWGEQGFTLTREQIEQDLTLIKEMGANFIRLVHYPHSRYTIEYAAKIGLMVSEEPGLWWSDLSNEYITDCALEIMRRTVLRDRCNPAVVAWLFFNECVLEKAGGYLKRGAEMCRALDPTRLLSGASCMPDAETKKVLSETGMDFYTQHPYNYEGQWNLAAAELMRDKPLVFTEWGGWLIHFNPNLIALHKNIVAQLTHAEDGQPKLSGMCWWMWSDMYQMCRGLPACIDGLLSDGLVDRYRNRKPTYAVMAEFFDIADHKPRPRFEVEEYPAGAAAGELTPVDLSHLRGPGNDALWKDAVQKDHMKRHEKSNARKGGNEGIYIHRDIKTLSGLRAEIPAGYPVILRAERSKAEIPVGLGVDEIYLFGAVTFYDGYPVRGRFGETAAKITLRYSDGAAEDIPMRHGLEIASAAMRALHSRIDPRAALAPRAAVLTLEANWEVYAVNLLKIPADGEKILDSVTIEATDGAFEPVIYAISVKETEKGDSK